MSIKSTAISKQGEGSGQKVTRTLWLAICETVVGRRRKATEGLAMIASAHLSAQRVEAVSTRQGGPALSRPVQQPENPAPTGPGSEIN